MQSIRVLATDMDGTFIPLEGNEENRRDLARLCAEIEGRGIDLVYVTGRHYELVLDAIESDDLPTPRWLICDVGTSIYESSECEKHQLLQAYHAHLRQVVGNFDVSRLAEELSSIGELRLQESEKQGPFKLSYYSDAPFLGGITVDVSRLLDTLGAPYRIISSVDPFTGAGFVDLLPENVSKDYALRWWVDHTRCSRESIVFAGDSGNDLAALTAGYRSIVVANADDPVVAKATQAHQAAGWTNRLYVAGKPATSGVLEGLKHFLDLFTDNQ